MFAIPGRGITLRKWLAWYHFLAGVAGLLAVPLVAPSILERVSGDDRVKLQLILLGMVALFVGVAGVGLALFSRAPIAIVLAALCQILQIPVFLIGPFQWTFFAGAYVVPYWQLGEGVAGMIGLKAKIDLSWGATDPTLLGINLAPLVILWLLLRKLPATEASHLSSDQGMASADAGASV